MIPLWGTSTAPSPTLSLDFVGATSLDAGITFSRGSQATLFNSAGTLVYAKHNLFLQSQFASSWLFSNASFTGTTTAPDGTNTGQVLNDSSAAAAGYLYQGVNVVSGAAYEFSVFAKPVGFTSFYIQNFTQTGGVTFTLTGSGSAAAPTGTFSNAVITAVGDGWYRCSATFTATGTASTNFGISTNSSVFTGDAWAIWGAQLNLAGMEGGVTSSLATYYPTTTAAYYAPRFDYNPSTLAAQGLLIEEQRTNSIRNNTMQGAVAGTPGTVPTNWLVDTTGGVFTRTISGPSTESGITYIDIQIQASAGGTFVIRPEPGTQVAALVGQVWTNTAYVKLAAGSLTNATCSIRIRENDAGGSILSEGTVNFTPTSAGLSTQRPVITRTLASATVAFIQPRIEIIFSGAGDLTLRIGLPQLEQGAFATSVIPTTTTALTRNADVASMTGTNFSSWFNSVQGTIFAEFLRNTTPAASTFPQFVNIDDGTVNNRLALSTNSSRNLRGQVAIASVFTTIATANAYTEGVASKLALGYQALNHAAVANGGAAATDTTVNVPSGLTTMRLGDQAGGFANVNGYLRRIAYYPVRLPGSTLQALTA